MNGDLRKRKSSIGNGIISKAFFNKVLSSPKAEGDQINKKVLKKID